MLIPYRVDVAFERRPIANYILIGSILVAFFPSYSIMTSGNEERIIDALGSFILLGWRPLGLIGHMWLHGGPMHLIGNLIFLLVFGNAICSKLGNALYVPAYLVVGLVAAITHVLFSDSPAIGASGAINGIVGMFLVFYPFNEVSCFYWIFRPGTFSISSLFIIGWWLAWDVLGALVFVNAGIAYYAHLGGFAGGVVLALVLEMTGLVKMRPGDESLTMMLGLSKGSGTRHGRRVGLLKEKSPRRERTSYSFDAPPPLPEQSKSNLTQPVEDSAGQSSTPIQEIPLAEECIRFVCDCGKVVSTPSVNAGKRARCPICKAIMVIPEN